jgi:hypothetical protein
MKLETLKKKLNAEFGFSKIYEELEEGQTFHKDNILLIAHYRDLKAVWMSVAYEESLKNNRTVVLVCPYRPKCGFYKKYVEDVAEVRLLGENLDYPKHRITKPMIIAIYRKKLNEEPNFTITFD